MVALVILVIIGIVIASLVSSLKTQSFTPTAADSPPVEAPPPQSSPLEPGATMRASIDFLDETSVRLFIQLSDEARHTLGRNQLFGHVMRSIPNPDYPRYMEKRANWNPHDSFKFRMTGNVPTTNPFDSPPPESISFTIANYCDPNGFFRRFGSPGEAKNWAGELRSDIQKLKEIIDYNAKPATNETFDL